MITKEDLLKLVLNEAKSREIRHWALDAQNDWCTDDERLNIIDEMLVDKRLEFDSDDHFMSVEITMTGDYLEYDDYETHDASLLIHVRTIDGENAWFILEREYTSWEGMTFVDFYEVHLVPVTEMRYMRKEN